MRVRTNSRLGTLRPHCEPHSATQIQNQRHGKRDGKRPAPGAGSWSEGARAPVGAGPLSRNGTPDAQNRSGHAVTSRTNRRPLVHLAMRAARRVGRSVIGRTSAGISGRVTCCCCTSSCGQYHSPTCTAQRSGWTGNIDSMLPLSPLGPCRGKWTRHRPPSHPVLGRDWSPHPCLYPPLDRSRRLRRPTSSRPLCPGGRTGARAAVLEAVAAVAPLTPLHEAHTRQAATARLVPMARVAPYPRPGVKHHASSPRREA